jgi:tRNA threonylcarbamoyladenosine biosynthesis protein TsaB
VRDERQVNPVFSPGRNFAEVYVFSRVWQTNCLIVVHVLILSLDTSSPAGSVAVSKDSALLAVISTTTDETYSSRIFRQLDFLLSELHLTLAEFDLFAVNAGPGSFTGLRVGLTTAKAWSEAFAKPVVPVSGLEAVAIQVAAAEGPIIPVIDARRGQVYAGRYDRAAPLARTADDAVMTPEEFLAWLHEMPDSERAILATLSSAWLKQLLSADGSVARLPRICEASPILAPVIGKIAFQRAQRGESVDALHLDANYVRRSDAELNWKGK